MYETVEKVGFLGPRYSKLCSNRQPRTPLQGSFGTPSARNSSSPREVEGLGAEPIVNPRKLEHRFRMIHAGIPYTLP